MLHKVGGRGGTLVPARRLVLSKINRVVSGSDARFLKLDGLFSNVLGQQGVAQMGTVKDMMVRAAIDHVTSTITANEANINALGPNRINELQDAEDADTWRAIVVRPYLGESVP